MRTLILATENPGKVREMHALLEPLGLQVITAASAGVGTFPPETGDTFEENAVAKARFVRDETGLAALADDSGLLVDALNGDPGVHSARYGGHGLDDAGRTALLVKNLAAHTNRTAHFASVIAIAFPGGGEETFTGTVHGTITTTPTGTGGFGYDPVFYHPDLGKTFGQASDEEKQQVSHRGEALRAFLTWLSEPVNILKLHLDVHASTVVE